MFVFEAIVGHTMNTYCVLGAFGTAGPVLPMEGDMIGSHAYLMAARASSLCPGWWLPVSHTPSLLGPWIGVVKQDSSPLLVLV